MASGPEKQRHSGDSPERQKQEQGGGYIGTPNIERTFMRSAQKHVDRHYFRKAVRNP